MPHLLCLSDLGEAALLRVLDASDRWLAVRGTEAAGEPLRGKTVALVFEKASTRTRVSLEIAVRELGGHPLVLTAQGSQMARGEPLADTARVLSRMVHAITFRTHEDGRVAEMARHSRVPVLNALSEGGHPLQLLADLMTVRRVLGGLQRLRFAWVGDGNNMARSWIEAAGLLRLELLLSCPRDYAPPAALLERANALGGRVSLVERPEAAVEGAHVISTDVFASMGQEGEAEARSRAFAGHRVTQALVDRASHDVMVLHCLPAHRGEEIDADVLEGPRSFVWDQAEARLHTAKAALLWSLGLDG